MGIKQLYNDNLRKLLKEYGDVSVMLHKTFAVVLHNNTPGAQGYIVFLFPFVCYSVPFVELLKVLR